jgi:leader peptidase (prepilin peptidase) / N-methyltransferase
MLGWVLPVAAGPFIGSFLGVLIRRLPADRPIAAARSCCDSCGHILSPRDMIPLASFALQRGRCRYCHAPIARFHVAVELAALAVAVIAALTIPGGAYPGDPLLWITCALGWWLLTLGWIDAETFRLPDILALPLILAGLAEAWFLDRSAIFDRAQGAALAAISLTLLALLYKRLRKRSGLGMGDAKLLAAGGAWVGVAALPWVLIAGALSALAWALVLRLRGQTLTATTRIPFGPFLAAGIWACWLLVNAQN